ncbi:CheY-like chemotaxis protein [Azospirillum fermentarium]|uniref:response regulator n=1 Tax=Azospirillum fermentarium TaxID=1233114 RepID=UPI00222799F4|nr:response regulator [Azospirillum fermentarium]MCW2248982.1 CheY-like chemotaxis protein [Azospirillum fermentarium]
MTENPAKILVVEDEGLVAMALQQLLVSFGYDVVGPAPSTRKALMLLAGETGIEGALLDVNLGDERVDPVAEALAAASIPFLFATAYTGPAALPPAFRDRPVLNKPYPPERLRQALVQLLDRPGAARAR